MPRMYKLTELQTSGRPLKPQPSHNLHRGPQRWIPLALLAIAGFSHWTTGPSAFAQESANDTSANATEASGAGQAAPKSNMPDLTIPKSGSDKELKSFIAMVKKLRPQLPQDFNAMQVAIRDASKELLKRLKGKEETNEYRQAELDVITASVTLLTFVPPEQQIKAIEQVHNFLKSRDPLSITDVQTGMLAASMLEMQANKKPARDTYQIMLDLLEDDEREEMQSLCVNLSANLNRLKLLGSKLELAAVDLEGRKIDIDDYAGKFVIVDFFATWCKSCIEEMPRLKGHYEKYRPKGLEVIGVSLDDTLPPLENFLEKRKLPWPIVHDANDNPLKTLRLKYGIAQLPTVLLLNKEGTVVSLEARGAELDRLMQLLFETPTPAPPRTSPAKEDDSEGS